MGQIHNKQPKGKQFNNTFIYNYREALNMQINNHANNIANSITTSYKSVSSYIDSIKTQTGEFRYSVTNRTNFDQGYLRETKKEFDYAIEGNGFFVLKCGEEIKYTRDGSFKLNNQDFIKSINGCYLLGQLYLNGKQEQVTAIDKFNLTPIKIDRGLIKGKATTTADISLSLSAKQMIMGEANGELTIDTSVPGTWSDDDQFNITFYQINDYDKSQTSRYNFIFNGDSNKSGFNGDTKTITFDSANKLATLVNNNLGHLIYFVVDATDPSKIKFNVKSSLGNNISAKFSDSLSALGKIGVNSFIDSNGYVKPNYKVYDAALNMAGGKIRADAKTEFSVIDSLGNDHEIFVAFKKIAIMKYAVEVYTVKGDVDNGRDDGLIAAGTIKFDSKGNGEIEAASAIAGVKGLKDELEFKWADEGESLAGPNNIKINWNKLQMYDDNQLINIDSDGKKGGILQSTNVDDEGNLIGHYSNREQVKLAVIPLAIFKDPTEELEKETGILFSTTIESNSTNPRYVIPKQENAGRIKNRVLEESNVDRIEETIVMEKVVKQLEILNTFEIKKVRANSYDDFKKMTESSEIEFDADQKGTDDL